MILVTATDETTKLSGSIQPRSPGRARGAEAEEDRVLEFPRNEVRSAPSAPSARSRPASQFPLTPGYVRQHPSSRCDFRHFFSTLHGHRRRPAPRADRRSRDLGLHAYNLTEREIIPSRRRIAGARGSVGSASRTSRLDLEAGRGRGRRQWGGRMGGGRGG